VTGCFEINHPLPFSHFTSFSIPCALKSVWLSPNLAHKIGRKRTGSALYCTGWLAGSARAELCCVKGGGTFIPVKVFAHYLLDVRSCKLLNEISDTFRSCSVSFFPLNQGSAHKPYSYLLIRLSRSYSLVNLSLFSYYEKIRRLTLSTTV